MCFASAELDAEAKAAAAEETRRRAAAEEQRIAEGRKKNGKTPAPPRSEPDGKSQRNFTDPDSRILKTKDGYIQGYNAQAAVDAQAQIIVAHGLTASMSDHGQLVGLVAVHARKLIASRSGESGRRSTDSSKSAPAGFTSRTERASTAEPSNRASTTVGSYGVCHAIRRQDVGSKSAAGPGSITSPGLL
jgi:hypothetical protein